MADVHNRTVLLESRGWRVVSVPFFSWYGVEEEGRRDFLQGLLARARSGSEADKPVDGTIEEDKQGKEQAELEQKQKSG